MRTDEKPRVQSTMNDVLASNSPLSRKPRRTRKTVSATWIPRQSLGARKSPRRMLTTQQMPTASPGQPACTSADTQLLSRTCSVHGCPIT